MNSYCSKFLSEYSDMSTKISEVASNQMEITVGNKKMLYEALYSQDSQNC